MIEIKNISKTFVNKDSLHHALDSVNLSINDGDIFGVIGVSGAGKSTLIRCINCLEKPTSGSVFIDSTEVTSLSDAELIKFRKNIGMIFQNFNLLNQKTVLQNVLFPLTLGNTNKDVAKKKALDLLEIVGLSNKASSYPSQLSGGQKQRVAIARALANDPKILLCDEATSALDPLTTFSILELLKELNQKLGLTIVLITHEISVVKKVCNRVAVIDAGRLVEEGFVEDVIENPQAEITQKLVEFGGITK